MATRRWNHNTAFYQKVTGCVPPGAALALDVGSGDGSLARLLAQTGPEVWVLEADAPTVEQARAQDLLGEFYPSAAGTFV